MGNIRRIYIPLCFYLYDIKREFRYTREQHLHSTMFLLIPILCPFRYIPVRYIYIPLCFYLYIILQGRDHPAKSHLHSTMFLLILFTDDFYIPRFTGFTFHYVSTYTVWTGRNNPLALHLHSTMFLLIPSKSSRRIVSCIFTFHYVSTYTYGRGRSGDLKI